MRCDSGREAISHGNTPGEHRPSLRCALCQRIHKVTPSYTLIRVPFHRRNLLHNCVSAVSDLRPNLLNPLNHMHHQESVK